MLLKAGYDRESMVTILRKRGFYATRRTVATDIGKLRQIWRETQMEGAEYQAHLDLSRIDDALKAITPAYRAGNLHAVDRLVNLIKLRSRIYGYLEQEAEASNDTPDIYQFNQIIMETPDAFEAMQRLRLAMIPTNGQLEDAGATPQEEVIETSYALGDST